MPVAVLLATYNGEQYLTDFLNSLFSQTFNEFICYVSDDGSTDNTMHILREYEKTEERLVILPKEAPTGSAKENFLTMLKRVDANIYFFADQDDIWLPQKIALTLKLLSNQNIPECVYTDLKVVDEELRTISGSFFEFTGYNPNKTSIGELIMENKVAGCTMAFNRKLRDIAIRYSDVQAIPMHDVWVAGIAALTGRLIFLNKQTVLYRQHGTNEMGAKHENVIQKMLRNLKSIFDGTMKKEKNDYHSKARAFAGELSRIPEITDSDRWILHRFSELDQFSKAYRVSFYKKYKFKKTRHNFWLRLWV
jgi:glycosyltransferase involved in cell wall biosynthesis